MPWFAAVFVLFIAALPAAACEEIRFTAGASAGEVVGVAPAEGFACYTFGTGQGQTARLRVVDGPGIAFSILGERDGQDDYAFTTRAGTYEVRVFQMFRAVQDQPFRLRLEIDAAAAAAPAAPSGAVIGDGRWSGTAGDGFATARVALPFGDALSVSCNRVSTPRYGLLLDAAEIPGLTTADGARDGVIFEVDVRGATETFVGILRRVQGNDRYWDLESGVTDPLLDAIAAGSELRLRTQDGRVALLTALRGSSAAIQAMRAACGPVAG